MKLALCKDSGNHVIPQIKQTLWACKEGTQHDEDKEEGKSLGRGRENQHESGSQQHHREEELDILVRQKVHGKR